MIARILVWLLFLGAAAITGRDGLALLETGTYGPIALGELWHAASPASLQLLERYLPAVVWTNIVAPPLHWPAWTVLAGTAVILSLISRQRRRKWRSGSFS